MTIENSGAERSSLQESNLLSISPESIGCRSCVEICPEVFAFDEEKEKARVIKPESGPEELVQEAIDTCPVECIYCGEK